MIGGFQRLGRFHASIVIELLIANAGIDFLAALLLPALRRDRPVAGPLRIGLLSSPI
jgi:hypothetical protein